MALNVVDHPAAARRIEVSPIAGSFVVHVCPRGPHSDLTKFFGDGELVAAMTYAKQLKDRFGWAVFMRRLDRPQQS